MADPEGERKGEGSISLIGGDICSYDGFRSPDGAPPQMMVLKKMADCPAPHPHQNFRWMFQAFSLTNSSNTIFSFELHPRITMCNISNCQDCVVRVGSVYGNVSVSNSSRITVEPVSATSFPGLSLDKSTHVTVVVPERLLADFSILSQGSKKCYVIVERTVEAPPPSATPTSGSSSSSDASSDASSSDSSSSSSSSSAPTTAVVRERYGVPLDDENQNAVAVALLAAVPAFNFHLCTEVSEFFEAKRCYRASTAKDWIRLNE